MCRPRRKINCVNNLSKVATQLYPGGNWTGTYWSQVQRLTARPLFTKINLQLAWQLTVMFMHPSTNRGRRWRTRWRTMTENQATSSSSSAAAATRTITRVLTDAQIRTGCNIKPASVIYTEASLCCSRLFSCVRGTGSTHTPNMLAG